MKKEFYVKIFDTNIDFDKTEILKEVYDIFRKSIRIFQERRVPSLTKRNILLEFIKKSLPFPAKQNDTDQVILNGIITQSFNQIASVIYKDHFSFTSVNNYYDQQRQRIKSLSDIQDETKHICENLTNTLFSIFSHLDRNYVEENNLEGLIKSYLFYKEKLSRNTTEKTILNNYTTAKKAQSLSKLTEKQVFSLISQVKEIWKAESPSKKISTQTAAELITNIWGIKVSRPTLSKFMKKHKISFKESKINN